VAACRLRTEKAGQCAAAPSHRRGQFQRSLAEACGGLAAATPPPGHPSLPSGARSGAPCRARARARSKGIPVIYIHVNHFPAGAQVADFQWVPGAEPGDPFTMVSVSDNGVGGTLQLWRINDMIWRPEDLVLAELEEHRRGSYL